MNPGTARLLRNSVLMITFLLGGMGIGGWLYAVRTSPPQRDLLAPPPYVHATKVRSENVTEHFTGFGTAVAFSTASVSAEVSSIVRERVNKVRAGTSVEVGQPILRLDDREFRFALEQAIAQAEAEDAMLAELDVEERKIEQLLATAEQEYRVATAEFERVGGLFERELAAEKEMNVATLAHQATRRVLQGYQRELALIVPRRARSEATRRAQQAIADRLRLDVARCTIVAPISGFLQSLSVDVGDRVGPGSPVATIVDSRRVEIPVRLPAASYAEVSTGASCRIESESLNGVAWFGEVARIAPAVDEQTRTYSAYLVVDNRLQEHPLVPGMFVRAVVEGPTLRGVLLVPRGAIRDGHLFVLEEGLARRRPVEVFRLLGERAVVHGRVRDGEFVILSNLDVLADGVPVRTAEKDSTTNSTTYPQKLPAGTPPSDQASNSEAPAPRQSDAHQP